MTDKELLELAAKAVGYEFVTYHQPVQGMNANLDTTWSEAWVEVKKPDAPLGNCRWNPINDDGDALRLAVHLKLKVSPGNGYYENMVSSYVNSSLLGTYPSGCTEKYGEDPCTATRRVIVRAAAEIGKTK
jgi:hypothetical protein